ncbi:ribonuclease H-like domain-containing protein [Tanacetum coccineum]
MAPMALSDSEIKTCSKTCLKNHETLKTQYDKLIIEFNKSESDLYSYKKELASVEERLVFYKKNEEKLKKEKEDNLLKINNYDNATKSLDKVIGSQLVNNNKKGLGYNAVPPPPTGLFAPPIIDLSHSGIEKFKEPEFEGYGPKASKNVNTGAPIIEDWESDSDDEDDKPKPKVVKKTVESKTVKQDVVSDGKLKKKTVFPTAAKIEVVKPKQQEKPVRKPVKYAEMYRSQKPRGNQRNWNNQKSHQLGSDFVMNNKACFACGSFNHLIKDCKRKVQKPIWNNARRVNHHNSHRMSYPHPKRNFVPKAVLMKTGMRPVNAAKPKAAYNAVKRNRFNAVKASACWVWMPKNRVVDHVSKNISASVTLKRLDYIDAQGRFKSVMAWMDAQAQGRQECSKEKEESREECSKSRKTKKMKWEDCWELNTSELVLPRDELVLLSQQLVLLEENSSYCSRLQLPVLNQSVNTARITVVGEKVNAAESLLVVSTEVNAN